MQNHQMGMAGQIDQQQQQPTQMQMLLQQNAQNQQQLHQPHQGQMPQLQQQNPQQLQQMAAAGAQKQQGINPMAAFQRNFPQQQDPSSTLSMTMQNYIHSQQQQMSQQQQQQRAQQQQQQQRQQKQQPQIPQQPTQAQQQQPGQAQQQMMRQQFQNVNQGNPNMNALNASNIYGQQHLPQQNYAANLAATQRQALSTLNQPINPTMQNPQIQQTPQQRPAQFAQMPDANAAAMFNQARNPLQSPAQLQQPLTPAEIQKIGEDMANFRYYVNYVRQGKGTNVDFPPHLRELYERAVTRLNAAKVSHPNLMDQLKTIVQTHMAKLEAENRMNQAAVGAGDGQGLGNLQQSVQQPLQQAQAAAAGRAQPNRLPNPQAQQDQQVTPIQQPGFLPQFQNLRNQAQATQPQGVQRSGNAAGIATQQPNQQGQQSLLQPGQIPNVSNITPQQLQVLQHMQIQQQRQFANNQQLLNNLQPGGVGGNQQLTPLQMQPFQQQLAQAQQVQQSQQQQQRPGDANPNILNLTRLIPNDVNPHNYSIPFETQQRLSQIGIPAERLGSWTEAIDWLTEARKSGMVGDDIVSKVGAEYQQVYQAINSDPRAFMQAQQLQRNMANMVAGNRAPNQMLMNQMQRQVQMAQQGQKLNLPQGLQNVPGGLSPQVQLNIANLQQQMAQQTPQPQAQALQAQQPQQPQPQAQPPPQIPVPQQQIPLQTQQAQQQQQQQQQMAPAQQRKPPARAPPKKAAAKKGGDSSNPMVIGNTPTPTNIPTPSPAQIAAQLPSTTPMNVASPNLPLPAVTPQGLGISPTDTHTPPQGQPMQIPDQKIYDQATAFAFVRTNIERIRNMMFAGANNLTVKNLSQEEKDQMRAYLNNPQTAEFIGRIDKLAPLMLMITRDENRTIEFLRLVPYLTISGQCANVTATISAYDLGERNQGSTYLHAGGLATKLLAFNSQTSDVHHANLHQDQREKFSAKSRQRCFPLAKQPGGHPDHVWEQTQLATGRFTTSRAEETNFCWTRGEFESCFHGG
jgi:hypothetical protein